MFSSSCSWVIIVGASTEASSAHTLVDASNKSDTPRFRQALKIFEYDWEMRYRKYGYHQYDTI